MIRVNMSRHLRLTHTTHVCYWRCPVPSCPLWFTSEQNGKDHIENIHHFREGRGYSFYECLREFGLEWFGSRAFFAEKNTTGQALWMDLALARRSGQELRNAYTIAGSPDFSPLRRFFTAAVDKLQLRYDAMPTQDCAGSMPPARSLIDSMREEIRHTSASLEDTQTRHSPVEDLKAGELPVDLPSVPVVAPVRSITPANRSLQFLETGAPGLSLAHVLTSCAVVPGMCIASTDLLSFIDPLPMDRLALFDNNTVCDWPGEDRHQLLAVAHRDLHIACRNVTDLTQYLDEQAAQFAMCAGAGDDSVPLMTVDTFPILTGGVRAMLDCTQW